jgi:hypothetical protein
MSSTTFRMPCLAAVGALAIALAGGALPVAAQAASHVPATAVPSLTGTWNFSGGIFKFAKEKNGRFTDTVVKQRPGVFCPNVNDKNGQIVLTKQKRNPREYKGTWKWFYTGSCVFAGNGPITITLSASGGTARLVSDPPSGLGGSIEVFTITREH